MLVRDNPADHQDASSGQKDFVQYGHSFTHLGDPWTKIYTIVQYSLSHENQELDKEEEFEATESEE